MGGNSVKTGKRDRKSMFMEECDSVQCMGDGTE